MLTIRLQPKGRKHNKVYRVVVAQKTKAVSKKCVENLGWYNPVTKDSQINSERATYYLENFTEVSSSVQSLFKKLGIIK